MDQAAVNRHWPAQSADLNHWPLVASVSTASLSPHSACTNDRSACCESRWFSRTPTPPLTRAAELEHRSRMRSQSQSGNPQLSNNCSRTSAWRQMRHVATRMNSPAGNVSASPLLEPSPRAPMFSSETNRSPLSTPHCRQELRVSCAISHSRTGRRCCLSATTFPSSG